MTDRQIFVGRAASAGTALGVLHRIDRDPAAELEQALNRTLASSPAHPSGTDATTLILSAFDAVAEQLLTLAETLRADQDVRKRLRSCGPDALTPVEALTVRLADLPALALTLAGLRLDQVR